MGISQSISSACIGKICSIQNVRQFRDFIRLDVSAVSAPFSIQVRVPDLGSTEESIDKVINLFVSCANIERGGLPLQKRQKNQFMGPKFFQILWDFEPSTVDTAIISDKLITDKSSIFWRTRLWPISSINPYMSTIASHPARCVWAQHIFRRLFCSSDFDCSKSLDSLRNIARQSDANVLANGPNNGIVLFACT